MAKREKLQITVPLDSELRAFAQQAADRDGRPVASWVTRTDPIKQRFFALIPILAKLERIYRGDQPNDTRN